MPNAAVAPRNVSEATRTARRGWRAVSMVRPHTMMLSSPPEAYVSQASRGKSEARITKSQPTITSGTSSADAASIPRSIDAIVMLGAHADPQGDVTSTRGRRGHALPRRPGKIPVAIVL